MLNCQKDVKLSKTCQKVKHLDCAGGSQKKINILRFTYIDVNFDIKYEGHQNWSKYFLCTFGGFLVTIIFDIKIDVNVCEPHYVNIFL